MQIGFTQKLSSAFSVFVWHRNEVGHWSSVEQWIWQVRVEVSQKRPAMVEPVQMSVPSGSQNVPTSSAPVVAPLPWL